MSLFPTGIQTDDENISVFSHLGRDRDDDRSISPAGIHDTDPSDDDAWEYYIKNLMKCCTCGKDLPYKFSYCPYCGHQL